MKLSVAAAILLLLTLLKTKSSADLLNLSSRVLWESGMM